MLRIYYISIYYQLDNLVYSFHLFIMFHTIKILQITACNTIRVLMNAIRSASLESPIFSPRALAHNLQKRVIYIELYIRIY